MQRPTCVRLRVRSPLDAQTIFHAVSLGLLPMVARRLDTEERRAIHSGCVFVWEERSVGSDSTSLGIERWTDGIRWGPSRVRDVSPLLNGSYCVILMRLQEFLFYHEKDQEPIDVESNSDSDSPYVYYVLPHAAPSLTGHTIADLFPSAACVTNMDAV